MTNEHNGEYYAASSLERYKEYQGGPVMQVVENITKAAMKDLFTVKEATKSKSKKRK